MIAREQYQQAADTLIRESGCTIRKYRAGNNGVAWITADDWGIEVPRPVGPASFAVFAHEVGHQLLHRARGRARWQEEIEAWEYALAQFDRFELPARGIAFSRAAKGVRRSIDKALRRSKHPKRLAEHISGTFPQWDFAVKWAVGRLDARRVNLTFSTGLSSEG